jgi:hypothetical protein
VDGWRVRLKFDLLTFDADMRQAWTRAGDARISPKAFEPLARYRPTRNQV